MSQQLGSFAVIQTGGKQYRVSKGDKIKVEKLNNEEGSKITFDEVLLHVEGEKIDIGKPILSDFSVSGKILKQGKAEKITVFKFKPKKRYQKKQGHRQRFTEVEIVDIGRIKKIETIKEK